MNELEELEQEGLDEQLLEVGGTADLPNVPATELPAAPGQFCKLNCRDHIFFRVLNFAFSYAFSFPFFRAYWEQGVVCWGGQPIGLR